MKPTRQNETFFFHNFIPDFILNVVSNETLTNSIVIIDHYYTKFFIAPLLSVFFKNQILLSLGYTYGMKSSIG